ncbi:Glu/Leu/Phe/Val family dehydrogenase [Hoyosella subflava]|uniref:Glu/Leu/Phe/Val dehydrogenase dimerization region n=1 Tax=Hoyosella subflava (strain DSM 45089 / JCM 17490 / NBRC 109087 / DQS3-9A1) TaxID=443218 RepID=F6EK29_HOYSD|nr:Glu/Leu/Phe/Val dehydrogenase dimerization domain-containing protein [Hoyosella subflava]AEF41387.1 Glu/Leu/Phe/Val dehydrogenase dimerization region [Hoyosella subflava DQS3-9A1]
MTRGVFERQTGHEQVIFCNDAESGLKAIIAIYSTALGPALGGTRFYPYSSEDDALTDVLNLSKGMAYKNALAGLPLGGGKAVIIGDPQRHKTETLLRAYGRFVESLGGRYITACDVGTYVQDMDIIGEQTRFVTGRSPQHGGSGDSSVMTSYGVYQGMRASAEYLWGNASLAGRRVGVAGVGKVGRLLVDYLLHEKAKVIITDVSPAAIDRVKQAHPEVSVADDTAALITSGLDIYAPCALGGALNDDTVTVLTAKIVCGAANNQLAHAGIEDVLAARGILYAPDYLVNAGGVVMVEDELHGFDFDRAKRKVSTIFHTTKEVFTLAAAEGVPAATAADQIAERRMMHAAGAGYWPRAAELAAH